LDWAPLAGSDPLAGDPKEILQEAARMRDTVAELTWQIKTLKGVGADGHLSGEYAEKLRVSATDVAAKLEKVIHRYTETARCLSAWAPELEGFQDATYKLLLQAQDAERAAGRDIHSDLFTPGLATYQQFHPTGVGDAPPELAVLGRQLQAVLKEAEDRSRIWAHQIAEAIDDQLTDGFWDHVHGWVENHKEQIEKYTSRLGWVATIAAVGALMVPGLNVAVLGGLGAFDLVAVLTGGGLLATHTLMAAEGQGSWWEVGIDAVGLASFGYGRYLGKGIGRAAVVTKEAGAQATGQEAAARYITMTREKAAETMANRFATGAEKMGAERSLYSLDRDAAQIEYNAAQTAREAPEAEAGLFGRLAAGSKEDADAAKTANQILAKHPGDQAVQDAAADVRRLAAKGRKNWWVAAGVDGTDKSLNHYWAGSYRGFKGREIFTAGIGWLQ
jgi:hypothetical protein